MKAEITTLGEAYNLELTAQTWEETHVLEDIRQVLADHKTSFNADMVPKRIGVKKLEFSITKTTT